MRPFPLRGFCQSGVWSTSSKPSLYRLVFTSSTNWIVPKNVKSALISIAGGGLGGSANFDGEDTVIMSSGASGGYLSAHPINLTPGENIDIVIGAAGGVAYNGLRSATPGGTSKFGNYLTCTGAGYLDHENWANVGNCGDKGGIGVPGVYVVSRGGGISGGQTPFKYGSGGASHRCNGCSLPNPTQGINGSPGVVIIDLLI